MSEGSRICPLCDALTDADVCPNDGVQTMDRDRFDKSKRGLQPGTVIAGRFKVDCFLGAGAMGGVYRCTQMNIHRPVALKTLRPEMMDDQGMVKRFYLEARAASQLDHPNIVRIYDFGIDEDLDVAYIAMEFLEGQDLRDHSHMVGRMSEVEACDLLSQVAKALVGAHEKGIIHRDLKPANINIRSLAAGEVQCKVLDFGIAKVIPEELDMTSQITETGITLGTPHYMSPEQLAAGTIDFRSDLYALGCILYELVAGERPFTAEDRLGLALKHFNEPPPPLPEVLSDGNAPTEGLAELIDLLLAKKAEDRPRSTEMVAVALLELSRGRTPDFQAMTEEEVDGEESTALGLDTYEETDAYGETLAGDSDPLMAGASDSQEAAPWDPTEAAPATEPPAPAAAPQRPPSEHSQTEVPRSSPPAAPTESTVSVPARRSPVPMALAAAALVAVGAWFFVSSSPEPASEAPATATPAAAPAPAPAPAPDPAPAPAPAVAPATAPAAAPAPAVVWVRLEVKPPGANVKEGDLSLGTAPVDVSFAADAVERRITVAADGYETRQILITRRTPSPMTVELKKAAAPAPAPPKAKSPPKRAPKAPSKPKRKRKYREL